MKKAILLLCVFLMTLSASAQDPQTGFPPYGSFQNGGFDAVNRQNLNVNFAIPIVASPGRGQDFNFSIVYDSLLWTNTGTVWSPNSTWGWKKDTPAGKVTFSKTMKACRSGPRWEPIIEITYRYYNYRFIDVSGTSHDFDIDFYTEATACNYSPTYPWWGEATDVSGIYLSADNPDSPTVTIPDGKVFEGGELTDTNGNFFSKIIVSSTETHWKDTVGRIALKVKEIGSTSIEYRVLDPNGNDQVFEMTLENKSIKTNFACSSVTEYTGSGYLPTKIRLPNLQEYVFEYEVTPDYPTYTTGRLSKVILPTGGYYEYVYTGSNNGINCADSTVKGLTRKINDGSTTATWTLSRAPSGPNWITTVDAPELPYDSVGNRSKFTFDSNGRLTKARLYQGTSTLKRTINTTWAGNGTPASATVILADTNLHSKMETTFDNYGNLTLLKEYDWGVAAPGSIIRTIELTYETGQAYLDRNIRNRVRFVKVRQGGSGGTIKAETEIQYDNTTLDSTSGVVQHDYSGYPASMTTRGNPTKIKVWRDADGAQGPAVWLETTNFYNDLGNLLSTQDPGGHTTTISYTDSWSNDSCASGTAQAFVTQVTNHLNHQGTAKYDSCTGQVASVTDPNTQTTDFTYDDFRRLLTESRPDGGLTTLSYNDAARIVTQAVKLDDAQNMVTEFAFDGLGRPVQSRLTSDPEGTIFTRTNYDVLGQTRKVWNPSRCDLLLPGTPAPTSCSGESTFGFTEVRYEGLGRINKIIPPDGTASSNNSTQSYSGRTVTVTDQQGKQRQILLDAIGRNKRVREPDSSGALTVETTYYYDALDNLISVDQGDRDRAFTYNSLSQLLTSNTPEADTTILTYDAASNLDTRKDARNITTTFAYDALHRLTSKTYSDSTPSVSFFYDQTSYNGLTITNGKGRMTGMDDAPGKEAWSYDVVGRVLTDRRTISGDTRNVAWVYNLAGQVISMTFPNGRLMGYDHNSAGRVTRLYMQNWGTSDYAHNITYHPHGAWKAMDILNGAVRQTATYNSRLQPTQFKAEDLNPSSTLTNFTYDYQHGTANNGNIMGMVDNVQSMTYSYTYDELNRLSTADAAGLWGLSFTYDRYSNLLNQTVEFGDNIPMISVSVNNKNRITNSGFTYDSAGNLTNDGSYSYQYDAENRMVSVNGGATATYVYDGGGRRVLTTVGSTNTSYWGINSGLGQVIHERENGSTKRERFFVNGQVVVENETAWESGQLVGKWRLVFNDHLGTTRLLTATNGSVVERHDYYPFGQERTTWDGKRPYKFTGYERDAESGNDYAVFRYHASTIGRFMTPDPLAGSISNPQSLNRYTYVLNNPLNLTDPLGLTHEREWVCEWDPDKEVFVCGWKVKPHSDPDNPAGFHGGCVIPGTSISVPCTVGVGTAGVWGDEVDPAKIEGKKDLIDEARRRTAETPSQAAGESCHERGSLSGTIPFTDIRITASLNFTYFYAGFSSTTDASAVGGIFPPALPSFGGSIDFSFNSPDPQQKPQVLTFVGFGRNLSVGTFLTAEGSKGLNISLGPSIGPIVGVSAPLVNTCEAVNADVE